MLKYKDQNGNWKELVELNAEGKVPTSGLVLNIDGNTATITQDGVDVTATIKSLMLKNMTWADLE